MELGVARAPPVIHSYDNGLQFGASGDDAEEIRTIFINYLRSVRLTQSSEAESELRAALQELLRYESAGFSVDSDRAIVRGFIESAHGDIARFEEFIVLKVLGLKGLRQYLHMHFC